MQREYAVIVLNGPNHHNFGTKYAISAAGANEEIAIKTPRSEILANGQWTNLTVTQEGNVIRMYVDGKLAGEQECALKLQDVLVDGSFIRIGSASIFRDDRSFAGQLDDIKLFNKALSQGEVQAEVDNKEFGGAESPFVAAAKAALDLGDLSAVFLDYKAAIPPASGTRTVTLTATISKDGSSATKEFVVTLAPAPVLSKDPVLHYDFADGAKDAADGYDGILNNVTVRNGVAEFLGTSGKNKSYIDIPKSAFTDVRSNQTTITMWLNPDDSRNLNTILDMGKHHDGINFLPLNNGKSVVTATLGSRRMRDPALFRTKDGGFGLVSTQGWDNPYIYFFDTDLVEFTNERLLDGASTDGATSGEQELTNLRAWAPEASYDPVTDQYYIYWSDPKTPYDDGLTDRPIYYNTSKDLQTLSEPGAYFSVGRRVIDATIVKEDGVYYMFYKCEEGPTSCKIYMATSTSLEPGSFTTDWVIVSDPNGVVEGPAITRSLADGKWLLYYDYFGLGANGGYGYSYTDTIADTSSWAHTYEASKTLAPSKVADIDSRDNIVSHGGLISVTRRELDRAIAEWKVEPVLANVLDVAEPDTVKAAEGDAFEALALPETVRVKVDDGGYRDVAVVWSSEGYSSAIGSYTLTGALTLPDNMKNTGNHTAQVTVSVEEKALPPVDKTELGALIALAEEALKSPAYTQESLDTLAEELAAARLVMEDDDATQDAVNDARNALEAAYQGLKLNLETELLTMSIALSKRTIEEYDLTQDSIDMLQAVIDAAAAQGVKLNIEIGGKAYLLSEYAIDASAVYYSAAELIAMADGETAAQRGAISLNPETGGEVAATMPNAAPEAVVPAEPVAPEAPAVIEPAAPAEPEAPAAQAAPETETGLPVWAVAVMALAAAAVIGGGVLLVVRRRNDN